MYNNLLRHKILVKILEHKQMFEMKKESFFSLNNLAEYFPNEKMFSPAILNLMSEDYIKVKKEEGVKKINIEEKGAYAAANQFFKEKNNKLIWSGIKDYGMLLANISVAAIALIALNKDNSKFAQKDVIQELQSQVDSISLKLSQEHQKSDSINCQGLNSVDASKE